MALKSPVIVVVSKNLIHAQHEKIDVLQCLKVTFKIHQTVILFFRNMHLKCQYLFKKITPGRSFGNFQQFPAQYLNQKVKKFPTRNWGLTMWAILDKRGCLPIHPNWTNFLFIIGCSCTKSKFKGVYFKEKIAASWI